jgi:hypothetical protein
LPEQYGGKVDAWGEHESFGGKFHFVSIASLDDVDPDELAAAPIVLVAG